jgi:hypothetical protein
MTWSLDFIFQIRREWQTASPRAVISVESLLHIVSAGTLPFYSAFSKNLKVLARFSRYMMSSADINLGPLARAAEYA